MGVARGDYYKKTHATELVADEIVEGIEEALVAVMVVQESFLREFGLDAMSEDERASLTGNVVAMSQLGCIAGALS